MSIKTIATLAAAAALTLTGCVMVTPEPVDRPAEVEEITAAPEILEAEEPDAGTIAPDPELEAIADELATNVCAVLDEMGVALGAVAILEAGMQYGFSEEEMGLLAGAAILDKCPHYADEINRLAG